MITLILTVLILYFAVQWRKTKGTWKKRVANILTTRPENIIVMLVIWVLFLGELLWIVEISEGNKTISNIASYQVELQSLETKKEELVEKCIIESQEKNQAKEKLLQFVNDWEQIESEIAEKRQELEEAEKKIRINAKLKFLVYFGK